MKSDQHRAGYSSPGCSTEPPRPHVTDGSPCWCGAEYAAYPQTMPTGSQSVPLEGFNPITGKWAAELPESAANVHASRVAAELAILAKVREAWAAYVTTIALGNSGATAADARFALVIELGRILAP